MSEDDKWRGISIYNKQINIMNRSYSKIRHIQESNKRLENRFINEVGDPLTSGKPLPFDVSEKDMSEYFIFGPDLRDRIIGDILNFESI